MKRVLLAGASALALAGCAAVPPPPPPDWSSSPSFADQQTAVVIKCRGLVGYANDHGYRVCLASEGWGNYEPESPPPPASAHDCYVSQSAGFDTCRSSPPPAAPPPPPDWSSSPSFADQQTAVVIKCRGLVGYANDHGYRVCLASEGWGNYEPESPPPPASAHDCDVSQSAGFDTCRSSPPPAAPPPPAPDPNVHYVQLTRDDDAFTLPVTIGGGMGPYDASVAVDTETFMLDTGASSVILPGDLAARLVMSGIFTPDTDLHFSRAMLADGNNVPTLTGGRLKSLTVGDVTVQNVRCTIGPPGTSLLLGQSFLQKFSSWSIDNTRSMLVLKP